MLQQAVKYVTITTPTALQPSLHFTLKLECGKVLKPCNAHEGYYAAMDGSVYTIVVRGRITPSRLLPCPTYDVGNLAVTVSDTRGVYPARKVKVARMVLDAWIGPPQGRRARHWDYGSKIDMLPNLYWSEHLPGDDLAAYADFPIYPFVAARAKI